MFSQFEPIFFPISICCITYIGWLPLGYSIKNLKKCDFDFYRYISYYGGTVKSRCQRTLGKIVFVYIAFYACFFAYKFLLSVK
jgi:hypothetical protein